MINILSFMGNVYKVLLGLDAIVYSFIIYVYKLFLILARINLFDANSTYEFVQRIYQVIGVIMIFILSYALLRKIVNPDAKDKESTGKMIFNVVKAIILLAIIPTVFSDAAISLIRLLIYVPLLTLHENLNLVLLFSYIGSPSNFIS